MISSVPAQPVSDHALELGPHAFQLTRVYTYQGRRPSGQDRERMPLDTGRSHVRSSVNLADLKMLSLAELAGEERPAWRALAELD